MVLYDIAGQQFYTGDIDDKICSLISWESLTMKQMQELQDTLSNTCGAFDYHFSAARIDGAEVYVVKLSGVPIEFLTTLQLPTRQRTKYEEAIESARQVMRSQFTVKDLIRNIEYMCAGFTPEQLYDFYERIYIMEEADK